MFYDGQSKVIFKVIDYNGVMILSGDTLLNNPSNLTTKGILYLDNDIFEDDNSDKVLDVVSVYFNKKLGKFSYNFLKMNISKRKKVGGVYIIRECKTCRPLYCGQSSDLYKRTKEHMKERLHGKYKYKMLGSNEYIRPAAKVQKTFEIETQRAILTTFADALLNILRCHFLHEKKEKELSLS